MRLALGTPSACLRACAARCYFVPLGMFRQTISGIHSYMAIINSMGVGRARKSAGNMTYRTVRGRTIGSQKIVSATTRVPTGAQSEKQKVFGLISIFMAAHAASINQSFDRTKYGSERNYFMKVNYSGLYAALSDVPVDATLADIEEAIETYATSNPTAIYRVKKSGTPVVYLKGAWDDTANPVSGVVTLGGSRLVAGAVAPALTTGQTLSIVGSGLSGAVVLVTAADLGGSTTENQSATALTDLTQNDSSINAKIAAAMNGKYLVSIKVGDATIISMKNTNAGGMG